MKNLFKAKRKKSPEPPLPPIAPGSTVDIAAGPPLYRQEQGAASEGGYSPYRDRWQMSLIQPYDKMRERA